ncbi:hypothetical protein [Flexivirga sp.]|uniref:hypothetical protein n=1 Tax=Flexivirga sp. TaxID=1962927 RepID=UPI003F7DF610
MTDVANQLDPVQAVRLLLADVGSTQYLTDEQITGYLTLNGGRVRRAAADALDAIAVSETLVSKVIRTQDLQTDGAKVADALRARAAQLRQQDDEDDANAWGGFDLVPMHSGRPCVPEHTGRVVDWDEPQVWGL